jgi:hypothetical protein
LGKELLSSYLLLHIYAALKEDMGSVITLAWLDSNFQDSSSLVASYSTPPAISDNQNTTTNEIILDRLASTPCLDKESLTSCTINGNINAGDPSILMTRTSSQVKKAPMTKKKVFCGKVNM